MKLRVPAKLNLHLEILGRRRDGFHELRTLLQSIDLYDELELEPAAAGELSLEVTPAGAVTAAEDNLVLRAARAVAARLDSPVGGRFRLHKRIPVGAGLGGGSGDAAAALVLACRAWGAALTSAELDELARGLGSDVPFFLRGGLALGVGRGDEIGELPDLDGYGVIVASSGEQVPTPEVYAAFTAPRPWAPPRSGVYSIHGAACEPCWDNMVNDLQDVVCGRWPETARMIESLAAGNPLRAALTGSGSAVFAVYPDPDAAERAAAGLSGIAWRHVGRFLTRREAALWPRQRSTPNPPQIVGVQGGS